MNTPGRHTLHLGRFIALSVFIGVLLTATVAAAAPDIIAVMGSGFVAVGDSVIIIGTDFGETPPQVLFAPGDIPATVTEYDHGFNGQTGADVVTCIVPKGVETTNTVRVRVGGASSNAMMCKVFDMVTGFAFDGHGPRDMTNGVGYIKYELLDKDANKVLETAYANEKSGFVIHHPLDNSIHYRIRATMETEDNKLKMVYNGGDAITFSHDFTYTNEDEGKSLMQFPIKWRLSDESLTDDTNIPKGDLENCASVWHYLCLNREAARSIGQEPGFNITLSAFDASVGAAGADYNRGTHRIRIGAPVMDDSSADPDGPPWQFEKNRESHEYGHAMMDAAMSGKWTASASDGNHSGYVNTNTGDSTSEGFAEFWACYVDKVKGITATPATYDGFGPLTVGAWKAWTPLDTAHPTNPPTAQSREEFAAAAVFWQLHTVVGMGRLLAALPEDGTLTDMYTNLGGAANVKSIYTAQGFFNDSDGDWTYDAAETIGAGNGRTCVMLGSHVTTLSPRAIRKHTPYSPNDFLQVDLTGVPNARTESWINVVVTNATNPGASYSYRTLVAGPRALIYLPLGRGASAKITAVGPAGAPSAGALDVTFAQWQAARALVASGAVMSTTFNVVTPSTGVPTNCTLDPSATTIAYGGSALLRGYLTSFGQSVPDVPVQVQSSASPTGPWANYGAPRDTIGGMYYFTVKPTVRTYYRVVSQGSDDYWSSTSPSTVVIPKAWVGNPAAPTYMSRTAYSTVTGYLKPKHTPGTSPVRIYKWRKVGTKWVPYGYVNAKASTYRSYTKYSVRMKLTTRGVWRLRAYHADAGHAATWSAKYDVVTVR